MTASRLRLLLASAAPGASATVRALATVGALGALGACGDAPSGARATDAWATVSVGPLDRSPPSPQRPLSNTLPVTVANAGPAPVFVNACGFSLERRVGGRWERVDASTLCGGPATLGVEVPAGAQRTFDFWVGAALSTLGAPGAGTSAAAAPAGPYRVNVLTLGTERGVLPEVARVSAPVQL